MGASVELRVRGNRDSQLAQCAVRGEALLLRREHVHAATAIVAVAMTSLAMTGGERQSLGRVSGLLQMLMLTVRATPCWRPRPRWVDADVL